MKLNSLRGRFEVLNITIRYIDDNTGEPREEILHPKYRPLTREWFAKVEQVEKQLEKIKTDMVDRLQKLGEMLNTQQELQAALDSANETDKSQAQTAYDEQTRIVERERALMESFLEESKEASSNLLAKQLEPILVDLDVTDEEGKPVKPTLEVLTSLDYELLLQILNEIKKKTSHRA